MKTIKHVVCLLVFALLVSCSDKNKDLLKIVPSDAVGVMSIDVPKILEKGGLVNSDGEFAMPAELKKIVEENDDAALSQLLTDLPVMGTDTDCKIFSFFTLKTFASVTLIAIDDEEEARKVIERRTGNDFKKVNELDCIYVRDNFYAIDDDVLFIGQVNMSQEVSKLASAARNMMSRKAASIIDNDEVMSCINAENDINAYMKLDGIKNMCRRSKTYREMAKSMPLVDIFVESDIEAYIASVNFNPGSADLDVKIKAGDSSEYVKLLKRTLSTQSADFLKAIPESMEYIVSMSVKGENFVKLPQINKMVKVFKKIPHVGKLDIESMLATIDGPVAAGLAKDPNFDDWNTVIAAKSTDPDAVVKQISDFATTMGQRPEIYDGEYIYEYDNKMVKIGTKEGVIYVKILNYEQTEGYAYDNSVARNFFEKSPMGIYVSTTDKTKGGSFNLGLIDRLNIKGSFTPAVKGSNSVVALLQLLCSIKPATDFDDVNMDDILPGGIDELQPVVEQ